MTWIVGITYLLFMVMTFVAPGFTREFAAKEGPLEHVQHVLLVAGIGAWIVAAFRAAKGRGWALAIAIFLMFVLGEELNWGEVVGITAVSDPLRRAIGRTNVHNYWWGMSYHLFALPLLALFGAGFFAHFAPKRSSSGWLGAWRAAFGDLIPTRDQTMAAGLVAVCTVVFGLALSAFESELDEVKETVVYVLLLGVGAGRRGGGARP
ncbi:hypothetical protein [Polyangium jinanense]|uniref:Uncharacterized protein n=1 Tax=Polyangium jinanense TaxID=2829994 RepID=A0A9X3XEK8_9BACT|nr:hypothetical protein [Polyangium jinanense]MDC3960141.1 hypothetical protein [Polyangium jinanense]MDC3986581.1 hypothetical protein [Polyangium jinanense]